MSRVLSKTSVCLTSGFRLQVSLGLFLVFTFCPVVSAARPTVVVTTYPLKYFAERVASNYIDIVFPVPEDLNPQFWMPDSDTIGSMQSADLILVNGATFEKWLTLVSLPPSKLIDTSKGFQSEYIRVGRAVTHSHGPEGEHTHGSVCFTTWLDFELALRQAQVIRNAFAELVPEHSAAFRAGYQELAGALERLHRMALSIGGDLIRKPLVASHSFLDYFARRYALNLKSLHWHHGSVPNGIQWEALETLMAEHPSRWMIWEAQPVVRSRQQLKLMGIDSIIFNPCYSASPDGDFLVTMENNLKNLKRISLSK
jgi:zinc transport system substrate-binding protein